MEDEDISCEICGITFWSRSAKSNRTRHMRVVHSTPKQHPCPKCDKSFSRKDFLQSHIKAKHDVGKEESLVCATCDKAFTMKEALTRHMKHVHEKKQNFICPECPEKFSRLENLRRHQKRGKHTFFFKCKYCEQKIYAKSDTEMDKHFVRVVRGNRCHNGVTSCVTTEKKRKKDSEERKKKDEELRNQTFYCAVCKKTIRGNGKGHIYNFAKYTSEDLNDLKEGKKTRSQLQVKEYVRTCQTMRLPTEMRDAALKREGILEFDCDSLKCGCGCGKASYSKVIHY